MARLKYNSFLICRGIKVDILERDPIYPYGAITIEVLKGHGMSEDEGQLIQIIPESHEEAVDTDIALRIAAGAFAKNIKAGSAGVD